MGMILTPGLPFHPGAGLNQPQQAPPSGGATIGEQLQAKQIPIPQAPQPAQPQTPNIQTVTADPKFQALSGEAQALVLSRLDPKFAALSDEAKQMVLEHLTAPPPKNYAPGREFGMEVARGMGLDADKIKAAEDKGGKSEALKEIGSQVFEGLSGFAGGLLKDPFNVDQPFHGMASGIETAVKQGSPGQLVGALSNVLGGAEGTRQVVGAAGKLKGMLPSTEHAAQGLKEVKSVAGDIPIDTAKVGDTALQLYEQSQRGASLPKVVRDFVNRVTRPGSEPITYAEAKDFQSNVSSLSAEERMQTKPNTLRLIGQLNSDLKSSLADAADLVGKSKQFTDAMKEYHNAMQVRNFSDAAKSLAWKAAVGAAATWGGAEIAKAVFGDKK